MISLETVKENVHYNPVTGIFIWLVSNSNRVKIGDIAGVKDKSGYIKIGIKGKKYLAHRLAWFYVYEEWPKELDHKDQIRDHNWIDNLRELTNQYNQRNTGNRKNNKSGIKGVTFNKQNQKWFSSIMVDKRSKYLGSYSDFDEAVCARLAGEQCLGWENQFKHSPAFLYVQKLCNRPILLNNKKSEKIMRTTVKTLDF